MTTVWIVGQVKTNEPMVWELGGVFTTKQLAVEACSEPSDCVFPAQLDVALSHESIEAPDCVYPLADDTP